MAETQYNTDFLRFSAYSFKDLLTRKLSEDTKFTDQIYEGSNIAILIDLCAYLFQGLTYCINTAAAESMFSDTQLYQNISRLVKLIGYNPKGFIPSTCEFQFSVPDDLDDTTIPIYTAIDTNKFDSQGNRIYYSFADKTKNTLTLKNGKMTVLAYNGRWKLYDQILTASGTKYETFVLTNIQSNSAKKKYAAHGFIDVYVQKAKTGEFQKFTGLTDEIFANTVKKYDVSDEFDGISIFKNSDDDRYYSIRLNEDKVYEIKFGNDNNGQKLDAGDKVYVLYLDSNGFDAQLQIGDVKNAALVEPAGLLGIDETSFYQNFIGMSPNDIELLLGKNAASPFNSISNVINTTASTIASEEESVDDIRSVAPDYYKLGNRLVSKSDFEYYVKNRYKDNIIDVKCQNNWDYISTFYGWLYRLGKTGIRTEHKTSVAAARESDPKYYIQQSKLLKYDYFYADPADENNVYLWIKMQNTQDTWKTILDDDLGSIKILTSEMVYVDPIIVNFDICAAPVDRVLEYFDKDVTFDGQHESYLEITIADNTLYSNTAIKTQVNTLFNQYFKATCMKIGQIVSVSDLESQLQAIPGVQRIRTVFKSEAVDSYGEKVYKDRYVDGISFATWSASLIDAGDDLVVGTTNRTLEDFQFPALYRTSIVDKIKVIKKSFSNNSMVQY